MRSLVTHGKKKPGAGKHKKLYNSITGIYNSSYAH